MVKAVIDVGSNSVLLLVARGGSGEWEYLTERTWVTGLGRGTKATGRLCEEGIAPTLDALREAFAIAQSAGAEVISSAATMAARIASNSAEFLSRCQAQGTPTVILSGEAEAQLGFLAVAEDPKFAEHNRLTIVDPGGHSTELVTCARTPEGWSILFRRSFAVGALGIRDGLWKNEAPSWKERLDAVEAIDDVIGMRYLPRQCGVVATLGATGTNLISIREGLRVWRPDLVHGAVLDFEEVSRAVGWLCDMDDAGRAAVVGLEPGREKTLHAGALILERFLHAVAAMETVVTVRGWRHAALDHPLDGWG
jgi:exopolyphosphatase / guanosine-5'-triphosphate,3'-diphosphate pyrophosphatase